jgi:PPP family 3-phenylpropionic acid transporter
MGWTTDLPWLIVAQILHCGTFTVSSGGDALSLRGRGDVIRCRRSIRPSRWAAVLRDDGLCGFLYQHLHGVFWVMALVALPAMVVRQKWPRALRLQHGANMFLLLRIQCLNGMDQRR